MSGSYPGAPVGDVGRGRVTSVDVYRGLVMFLLVPNPYSAFGVKAMAEREPDSRFWRVMSGLFTHVPWEGMSVWDMVMPSFIVLMGVAMTLSADDRAARGERPVQTIRHSVLRALALVVLGLSLAIRQSTRLEELWPILFLCAWAAPTVLAGWRGASVRQSTSLEVWWLSLIGASIWFLAEHLSNPGIHHVGGVLVQAGLASLIVCGLARRRRGVLLGAAFGLLCFWWIVFMAYPAAPLPAGESGRLLGPFEAHWARNANVASAFDQWFFELFPRSEPFELHAHGYQLLNFVPTSASILFGMVAGRTILESKTAAAARNRLVRDGAMLGLLGLVAAVTVCPLIKSLWTPSWALASSGLVLLALGFLHHACDVVGRRRWGRWFVLLGTNSILAYVLSYYSWRLLQPWQAVLGNKWAALPQAPLIDAVLVLVTLLIIAAGLERLRIRIRL